MNDSNPFSPTQTPNSPTLDVEQKTGGRGFEIVHNIFRGLFAFICVALIPVFILAKIHPLFDEFGVELPLMSQLILRFSLLAYEVAFLFLPISFIILAVVEWGIFAIPSGKSKTLINTGYWLALILVIGSACFSLVAVYNNLFMDVTATIDLSPILF